MAAELVVVEHHPRAGASAFTEALDARAHLAPWRTLDPTAEASLPEVASLAGILVLGGPMGVPDAEEHPWMAGELAWLGKAVDAEVPVLGVCLGAQLLAAALDGRVERRETPEVGYVALTRTEQAAGDELAAGWPDGTTALFFHEDEITELPEGADVLLTGGQGPAAWRWGSGIGLQFHPEVTHEQLASWVEMPEARAYLDAAGVDPGTLLEEAARRERFTVAQGRALLNRWIDGPVRKRLAG